MKCPLCGGSGGVERKANKGGRREWERLYRILCRRLGRPPSVRMLAAARGKSRTAAYYFMRRWIGDCDPKPKRKGKAS